MILICGGLADSVTELMCARLEDCGFAYRFLDLGRFPHGFSLHCEWRNGGLHGAMGCEADASVGTAGWTLPLEDISAVYARYLGAEGRVSLPGLEEELHSAVHAEADTGLLALFEDLPCPVVNRYRGGMSNNSKPCQALLLQAFGFAVPETLVTNDPEQARSFFDEHDGEVIFKSLSGIRSIVRRVSPEQRDRFALLRHGPAQFQAYVPGDNVRVHVVGSRVFATRIHSDAVDYRYAKREGLRCEMCAETLAPAVEEACVRVTREMDLLFAGVDLKITPEGEVFCFEVNPSPGFTFFERGSGQPISTALAELLHEGSAGVDAATELRTQFEQETVCSL